MDNIEVGKNVIWHDGNGNELARGVVSGIRFTSNLGNIYQVGIYVKKNGIASFTTKNIHQRFLKVIK